MNGKVVKISELPFGKPKHRLKRHSSSVDDVEYTKSQVERRRELVFDYKLAGLKYAEIARKLKVKYRSDPEYDFESLPDKYDESHVAVDVKKEVDKYIDEVVSNVEKHVVVEIERIESMIKALWDRATKSGNSEAELEAIDRIIKLQKRKAKLMGLDAPETIDILDNREQDEDIGFRWADPDELELGEEEYEAKVTEVKESDSDE